MRGRGSLLTDRVFTELVETAASGADLWPDTRWTCGKCLSEDGIRVKVADSGDSKQLNRLRFVLTCRCCSQPATCPHDWPYHGEIRFKPGMAPTPVMR